MTISGGAAIDPAAPSDAHYRHLVYQPHVDGLRAIAVLSVIAFHAFPQWAPGGFVGVDVFFVISGYLICGIIFRNLEAGGFSFAEFYARRIRRIFPALILVLGALLAFGWIGLIAAEYKALGFNVAGGAAFASNLLLWGQTSYFAPDARTNPLLHLWSLGIEEQFYIAWPVILCIAWRWRMGLAVTMAALVASLATCLMLTFSNPVAAFYSPLCRLWELQAGAIVGYFAPRLSGRATDLAAWSGAALLVAAFVLINDKSVAFPGFWALLPVAGAALMIAGKGAFLNRAVLSRPAMVWVGLISYPLYLWHWPLLSLARVMDAGEPPATVRALLIVGAVCLAWMTYRFIERPIRSGAPRPQATMTLAAGLGIAALAGLIVWRQDGLVTRPIAAAYAKIGAAFDDWTFPDAPIIRNGNLVPVVARAGMVPIRDGFTPVIERDGDHFVAFLGDSHMEQYWPRLELLYRSADPPALGAIFATFDGCPPFLDSHYRSRSDWYSCDEWVPRTFAFARGPEVSKVVFGAAWKAYSHGMPRTMDEMLPGFGHVISNFIASGKSVTVILDNPVGVELNPRQMLGDRWRLLSAARRPLPDRSVERRTVVDGGLMLKIAQTARQNGAAVVDPADYLCSADACPTLINGEPLYFDVDHIRAKTARERAKFMDEFVRQ